MRKRQGFALLWAVSAVSIVFLLGGTAFFMLRQRCALNRPWRLRRMKLFWYRKLWKQSSITAACRARSPVPSGDLERNGRRYHILIEENHRTIEGVEMREVSCTVTDKTGTSFSAVMLLEAP